MPHLSHHAARRCSQRSIPQDLVEIIYSFGSDYRSHGATGFVLDRHALDLIRSDLGREAAIRLDRYLGAYLILSDAGIVITAAHGVRRRRLH